MDRFKHMMLATAMIATLIAVCGFQELAAFQKTASIKNKLRPLTAANR